MKRGERERQRGDERSGGDAAHQGLACKEHRCVHVKEKVHMHM